MPKSCRVCIGHTSLMDLPTLIVHGLRGWVRSWRKRTNHFCSVLQKLGNRQAINAPVSSCERLKGKHKNVTQKRMDSALFIVHDNSVMCSSDDNL